MKKIIKGLCVFIFIFGFTSQVDAIERNELINSMNDSGRVVLLCEYADSSGTVKNEIYYMFGVDGITTYNPWSITYQRFGNLVVGDTTSGTFEYVFVKNSAVSYSFHNGHLSASKESDFTCPKYSFIDYDGVNEICFAETDSCGPNFKGSDEGPFSLTSNSSTIYNVMNSFVKNAFDQVTFDEYRKSTVSSVLSNVKSKALQATKEKYKLDSTYITPSFVTNYFENEANLADELERFKSRMSTAVEEAYAKGELSLEEKEELKKKNKELSDAIIGDNLVPSTGVKPDDDTGCNSILGDDMSKIIDNIFKTIQYAGPILVIVLTALDMLKAVTSGEQDQMKKASNKFVKRLIAAMLLFFVPLLCNLVFDVVGITVPDSCIGQVK